jgi:hydrogenase maturation protein HypF
MVLAEVQGDEALVESFSRTLAGSLPPAALIQSVETQPLPVVEGEGPFRIAESGGDAFSFPPIPPDLPLCADCARELLDPSNRRFLYPFITCTQCGPRYSIVEATPFDRDRTTMRPFAQCPSCAAEYRDPRDRRFHSQTNSCGHCGPRLSCRDATGGAVQGDPLLAAIDSLLNGGIVALQGIGGFHLAADPRRADAVARLRREKDRERKPFALMVRDLAEARSLCALSDEEVRLLCSPAAPIVIAERRVDAPAWLSRVSDTGTLGVMLPTTPLHLLLFQHPARDIGYGHLIMTSGNRAAEPIVTQPEAALSELAGVADLFLFHDRRIAFRTDDSVVRQDRSSKMFIMRRSRGYVPRLLTMASPVKGVILALGGDLKNAPALARERDLHLCAYIGDLEDMRTYAQFEAQIRQVLELYDAAPDVVVRDMHPLYHSSRWNAPAGARTVQVQHHHAHALSVMAEHGLEESLALCFDGTGYGTDASIWGGEFLHATRSSFTRLGSFAPFFLPGGEAAVLHPPRIALSLLGDEARGRIPGLAMAQEDVIMAMLSRRVSSPESTSLGRIFDAAAALLGLVNHVSYEGEGPIRLEGMAMGAWKSSARFQPEAEDLVPLLPWEGDDRLFVADPRPLLSRILADAAPRGTDAGIAAQAALLFHEAIAMASRAGARRMRRETGIDRVALCGGVFQNLLLREILIPLLINDGFHVFLNESVPPGDGGLSVGQAWFEER